MEWTKWVWAIMMIGLAVLIFPKAMHWMKHGPRGSASDWRAAVIPLALVFGFILFLVYMVRG